MLNQLFSAQDGSRFDLSEGFNFSVKALEKEPSTIYLKLFNNNNNK